MKSVLWLSTLAGLAAACGGDDEDAKAQRAKENKLQGLLRKGQRDAGLDQGNNTQRDASAPVHDSGADLLAPSSPAQTNGNEPPVDPEAARARELREFSPGTEPGNEREYPDPNHPGRELFREEAPPPGAQLPPRDGEQPWNPPPAGRWAEPLASGQANADQPNAGQFAGQWPSARQSDALPLKPQHDFDGAAQPHGATEPNGNSHFPAGADLFRQPGQQGQQQDSIQQQQAPVAPTVGGPTAASPTANFFAKAAVHFFPRGQKPAWASRLLDGRGDVDWWQRAAADRQRQLREARVTGAAEERERLRLFGFLEAEAPGGSQNLIQTARSNARIGVMVAGNHAQPLGSLGGTPPDVHVRDRQIRVHEVRPLYHRGQEESLVSNAVYASTGGRTDLYQSWFAQTVRGRWGLTFADGNRPDFTVQGTSYRNAEAGDYYEAWASHDVQMCAERRDARGLAAYDLQTRRTASLYYVAGPQCNATPGARQRTSMEQTLNRHCTAREISERDRKQFHFDATVMATAAGLDAMFQDKVDLAVVAALSSNIYAPHQNNDFHRWYPTGDALEFTRAVLLKVMQTPGPGGRPRGETWAQEGRQVLLPRFRKI